MCLCVSVWANVCVCACVTRAFCPAELGPALMSLTALTWRCCLWWLNRFSPYREVCAGFFWYSGFLSLWSLHMLAVYQTQIWCVLTRKKQVFNYKEMQHRAKAICVGCPAELQAQLCSAQHSSVSYVCYERRMTCVIRCKSQKGTQIFLSPKLKFENVNRFLLLHCC